jgi:hypothetical protein
MKFKNLIFYFSKKNFFSLWWAAGDVMGKHFPFLSLSLSSLCVIYHRGFSQYTATKTTKLLKNVLKNLIMA